MKRATLLVAAGIAAATLTGCQTATNTPGTFTPGAGNVTDFASPAPGTPVFEVTSPQTDPTTDTEPVPSETTDDPTASPTSIRFGETWKWEDGVEATVSKPRAFKPAEYASGGEKFKKHVKFTITVKNGSKVKLELVTTPTMSSGDFEAEPVFDGENNLNGPPETAVQPGRTIKFDVGYGVKNPADLVLEYAPTFDHADATFTSE